MRLLTSGLKLNEIGSGLIKSISAFSANLVNSLVPSTGKLKTFGRASTATVTDFEGLVKDTNIDEARFIGARRVENVLTTLNTTNLNICTVLENQLSYDGSNTAFAITAQASGNGSAKFNWTIPSALSGTDWRVRYYIKADPLNTGNNIIEIYDGNPLVNSETINVTDDWGIYATSSISTLIASFLAGLTGIVFDSSGTDVNVGDTFYISAQLENVTGQANQKPSEFVSVGAGTETESCADPEMLNAAAWTLGLNTTVVDGQMVFTSEANDSTGNILNPRNVRYSITVVMSDYVNGSALIYIGDTILTAINSNGTHTFNIVAVNIESYAGAELYIDATAATFKIDSISIKEIQHGSNVDGVKYFNIENGNIVTDNVIVEADGTTIPNVDLKGVLIEDTSTNSLLSSTPSQLSGVWWQTGTPDETLNISNLGLVSMTGYAFNTGENVYFTVDTGLTLSTRHEPSFYFQNGDFTGTISLKTLVWGVGEWTLDTDHASLLDGKIQRITREHPAITVVTEFSTDAVADAIAIQFSPNGSLVNKSFRIGGVQVEENTFSTSYIPTTGSTVSRSVDELVYNIPTALIDANKQNISAFVEINDMPSNYTGYSLAVGNSTEAIILGQIDVGNSGQSVCLSGTPFAIAVSTLGPHSSNMRIGLKADDIVASPYQNGIAYAPLSFPDGFDFTGADIVVRIGSNTTATSILNGCVKNAKLYDTALSNAKMLELTS